jgi:hypothetical protein
MSDVDKYRKLLGLSGARQSPRNIDGSVSYDLKGEVAKRLAALKKDLTWTDLPNVDMKSLPNKKFTADDATAMAMDLMQTTPAGAFAGVIKEKGGNWLGDSVKKAMEKLHRGRSIRLSDPTTFERLGDDYVGPSGSIFTPEEHTKMLGNYNLNNWVEGPLSKYVKNRMATPDDEIRKLADQGILHVNPEQLNFRPEMYGKEYAMQPGQRNLAISDTAKVWEGASDNSVSFTNAGKFPRGVDANHYDKKFLEQYPWIEKLTPETPVYGIPDSPHFANDVGFDHMMDELSNAMDETSGFPQHLRLTPEGLQGLSVEEAVKKVDGINKFRAEKAKKANARFAKAEGIPVYKEYDEGWKWLEYKKPDEVAGLAKGEQSGYALPTGDSANPYQYFDDIEDAKKHRLGEWLKQEGDTMGHCVGGYCDDVTSGRSRILSLRDNEGKSVATVELAPADPLSQDQWRSIVNELEHKYPEDMGAFHDENMGISAIDQLRLLLKDYPDDVHALVPDIDELLSKSPWSINQIKGAGNKRPPKAAIPFIQDFVKNGDWKDIRDLGNADLTELSRITGEKFPHYLTKEDALKLMDTNPSIRFTLEDEFGERFGD